jgi:hypothetical protein
MQSGVKTVRRMKTGLCALLLLAGIPAVAMAATCIDKAKLDYTWCLMNSNTYWLRALCDVEFVVDLYRCSQVEEPNGGGGR